jgi:hypothetical protein
MARNTDIEDRKRAEALLATEKRTLEMISSGDCLGLVLTDFGQPFLWRM